MISVVMATFNGSSTLPIMLEALCELNHPDCGVEYIFVDNASTDSSACVIRNFQDRLPITLLEEKQQGKNFAIITGIAAANGDLFVFTDDDVIPEPDWLTHYERAATAQPNISVFAGQIRHHWLRNPSDWLAQLASEGRAFGGTPVGLAASTIKATSVKGANFMVRRTIIEKFSFNTRIGPSGRDIYVAGSETEYLLKVEAAGYIIEYIPTAIVKHIVQPEEMTLATILKRYYRIGMGMESTNTSSFANDVKTLFGYPRYLYKKIAVALLTALMLLARANLYGAVVVMMNAAILSGQASHWKSRKSVNTQPKN